MGHGPSSPHSNTRNGGIGHTAAGLGMYPGTPAQEPCYDPNRPSWMPYWLDTLSEETCWAERLVGKNTVLNFANPQPGPVQPATTDMLTNPDSGTLDTSAAGAMVDAWQEWGKTAIPDTPQQPSSAGGIIAIIAIAAIVYWILSRR